MQEHCKKSYRAKTQAPHLTWIYQLCDLRQVPAPVQVLLSLSVRPVTSTRSALIPSRAEIWTRSYARRLFISLISFIVTLIIMEHWLNTNTLLEEYWFWGGGLRH